MADGSEQIQPNELGGGVPPAAGERYGDYEVIKPLTSGGMADIFLARKLGAQGFQKLVVVKRIRREMIKDDHVVDMFIDEAHVAAKLDHPNVVVVSDLGEVDDSYFMAMEYLRGQTLRALDRRLMEQGKMLPQHFWARVMEYALDGLHYAHELRGDDGRLMGLVHRDFTPSNIMITYSGTVKVIDFGVAHVEAPTRHETKIGTIKGKVAYMSPEQCKATQHVDRQTDVFAAGIVLWELLSRRQLFDGPTETAVIVEVLLGNIPLPGCAGAPEVDARLRDIVMKALERDQALRYRTAAEMRDDLRDYLRSKQEKVDATDIGQVMCQLFEHERAADEALSSRGADSASKSRSGRSSSKSGRSSSTGVKVAAGIAARAEAQTGAHKKGRGGLIVGLLAVPLLGGAAFGAWKYTHPVLPPPPVTVADHVEHVPPPEPVKPPPEPVKPPPEPVKPVVAENPPTAPETPAHKPHGPKEPNAVESTGGFGTLDFDTRPYTEVFLGKKKLGDTPLIGVKVPAGTITVKLVNDDAGIHESYTITVPKDGRVVKKLKL